MKTQIYPAITAEVVDAEGVQSSPMAQGQSASGSLWAGFLTLCAALLSATWDTLHNGKTAEEQMGDER